VKLARFLNDGKPQIGVVREDLIFPLAALVPGAPDDMIELITSWTAWHQALDAAEFSGGVPLAGVKLLAPVIRPGKIMAIGLNYADHIAETGNQTPEHQIWFTKAVTSINGPFDPIQVPKASSKIDYEVEMVAIIGKGGRHISTAEAPAHVFGYCVGNDVSVRDWQRHTPQWVLGKSFDTHGVMGPWITTADELGEPHRLNISCTVNGDVRQSSNTKNLVFTVWDQIELLSKAMTLEPGDVIYTGTPGGIGAARKPPVFLAAGDKVVCEIAELGKIEGVMVDEE
jgi:2-keto-4-pentenoate hydratase/2-oxohepta-3-ene-1,7-dioic acid hydratase in catechol pathway